ncbi:MAG: CCA tRNA nucleotidyltransferase [Eubacteriales bacterium]|nr:CCA tRNA nucleotidyltransferase [Eubacteriales bacterium]
MAKRSIRKERYFKIQLPEKVSFIIGRLEECGFEAFAVGGCIRDSLLGRQPGDWDITTSALPGDIKSAFRRTVDTGIEHGTVTVMLDDESFEVTTYRIDGEYKDGRHPEEVTFTDAISEDLRRRDFTVNAMAYNEKRGLIDLFGGKEDLKKRVIRCVGDPNDRFDEDALRILRAVRFAAQLDFDVDSRTRDAISNHAPRLKAVSKERILTEVSKLICSAHIERTAEIFQLGIVPYTAKHFREINIAQLMGLKRNARHASSIGDAFDLNSSTSLENRYIRFAFLTEGMSRESVDEMLRDLKADNITRKNAALLSDRVLSPIPKDRVELKRIMSGMSPELFADLLRIKLVSAGTIAYEKYCADEDICGLIDIYNDIAAAKEPVYLTELAVGGDELKSHGAAEGPEIGRLLHRMLEHVWAHPEDNNADYLLGISTVDL